MVKVELTPEECHFICRAAFYTNRCVEIIEQNEEELAGFLKEKETALPRRTKTLNNYIQMCENQIKHEKELIKVMNSLMKKLKEHAPFGVWS